MHPGAPSRRASSTSTRTSTPRSSGIRSSNHRRITESPPWWRATAGSPSPPAVPEHHDVIVRTLENVEGMDANSLAAGIVWDFETFPDYLDLVRRRGNGAQLHRVHRPHRAPALRHGGRRLRTRRHPRRDRPHVPARERGHRCGRRRFLDELLVCAPWRRRQAGSEPICRDGRGRGAVHDRGEGREGGRAGHAGLAMRVPRRLHLAASASAGRSPVRCSRSRVGSISRSSSCTRRRCPVVRTSGHRSRLGR